MVLNVHRNRTAYKGRETANKKRVSILQLTLLFTTDTKATHEPPKQYALK